MTRWFTILLALLLLPVSAFAADAGKGAVSITASTNAEAPYQNQSILYTVRVIARANISKVSLSDIHVPNAIVERQGEPNVRESAENGAPVNLIEFHFIITPLKPGVITVPPAVLQGEVETPNGAVSDAFGGSFMAGMLRAMNAISAIAGGQSFNVASNTIVLNVSPPVAATGPWLPLASLKITEDMPAEKSVRVGDLLTRKITLSATGAVGSQLPDVEEQQNHRDFRIYADKPTMGQGIGKTGVILGWRTETFSLVPQRPGAIVLPAVTVSWWDVDANRLSTATLPERTIRILPGAVAQGPANDDADLARGRGTVPQGVSSGTSGGIADLLDGPWKALAAVVIGGLLAAGFWWLSRRGKIRVAKNDKASVLLAPTPGSRTPRPGPAAALKDVRDPEELKSFLQDYAQEHWGTARNASLEKIFATRKMSGTGSERDDVDVFVERLSAALYAGRLADMEDLKTECRRIITASKSVRTSRRGGRQKLAGLNPD